MSCLFGELPEINTYSLYLFEKNAELFNIKSDGARIYPHAVEVWLSLYQTSQKDVKNTFLPWILY
jgi:hypothetical protein